MNIKLSARDYHELHKMIVRDRDAGDALLTPENERTEYQKNLIELWDKLEYLTINKK